VPRWSLLYNSSETRFRGGLFDFVALINLFSLRAPPKCFFKELRRFRPLGFVYIRALTLPLFQRHFMKESRLPLRFTPRRSLLLNERPFARVRDRPPIQTSERAFPLHAPLYLNGILLVLFFLAFSGGRSLPIGTAALHPSAYIFGQFPALFLGSSFPEWLFFSFVTFTPGYREAHPQMRSSTVLARLRPFETPYFSNTASIVTPFSRVGILPSGYRYIAFPVRPL